MASVIDLVLGKKEIKQQGVDMSQQVTIGKNLTKEIKPLIDKVGPAKQLYTKIRGEKNL